MEIAGKGKEVGTMDGKMMITTMRMRRERDDYRGLSHLWREMPYQEGSSWRLKL
jgi:hypothetical protein